MADKQQNIFVNWKFNTAELEKSTQLTNRANEANNKLQQSAQNAGRGAAQSYAGTTDQLKKLTAEQKRLEDAIKGLRASAFPTIKAYSQALQPLSAQYAKIKQQVDQVNKSLRDQQKELKAVSDQSNGVAKSFGQVATAIKLAFTAAITREVVNTTLELSRLAGNTEGVERAFNRAFPGSKALMMELQSATHGTVTEFQLMQRTLQATNLGLSVQQLPILFEFAATRAQQTGESVDYLVDSIVTGIGRKSILKLDNLGLSATRLREQFDGAALASKSVADVTAGVADIARVELQKMGGYAETAATKVDALSVSWQKLRTEVSKRFEEGGGIDFLKGFIDSADLALEAQRRGITISELAAEKQREFEAGLMAESIVRNDLTGQREKDIEILNEEIKTLTRSLGAYVSIKQANEQQIKDNQHLIDLMIQKANAQEIDGKSAVAQIKYLKEWNKEMKYSNAAREDEALFEQALLKILQSKVLLMQKDNAGEREQLGIIEQKKEQIERIEKAIEKTRNSSDLSSRLGVGKLITDLAVAQAELKELLEGAINQSFKIDSKPIKDAVKEFEKLIDIVKGVDVGGITLKPLQVSIQNNEVSTQDEILLRVKKMKLAPPAEVTTEKDFWDELSESIRDNQEEITESGLNIFADQLVSFEDAELASLQNRLNNLRNFYDEQQLLAGDNDRAKQELRLREERETAALQKRIAQKEKEARRFSVIVDTAAGIVKAFANAPFPLALIQSAIIAAQGASQLAIINRTQPRFAKGVINLQGPGTGTSDSIQARLSKGESVMTNKETQSSMGILKDIRAKKLDDNVLKDLKLSAAGVTYTGMDDSRIVKEIQELKERQPDIVEQSGKLYKQYSKGKSYKVKSRISAMGY